LKFIKEIELSSGMGIDMTANFIQLITNNCNDLRKFVITDGYFDKINEKQIKAFGEKFGHSLRYVCIHFINDHNKKLVTKLFDFLPKLKTLIFDDISVITSKLHSFYSNLEEVKSRNYTFEEIKFLADNYHKQINKFKAQFGTIFKVLSDTKGFNSHLIQLSRFENLESLKLSICSNGLINEGLEVIAKNCKLLKNLSLSINPVIDSQYNIKTIEGKIFQLLAKFVSLERLRICLEFFEPDSKQDFLNFIETHYGNIESLKTCTKLKHLSIRAPYLTDDHFKDIDKHLPQLKSIKIDSNSGITDRTLKTLAKMKSLSKVEVKENEGNPFDEGGEDFNITDSSVSHLLNGCPLMKEIKFDCYTKLTQTSIDSFIDIAKSNPKILYNFYFYSINKMDCDSDDYYSGNVGEKEDNLHIPDNLSLEYTTFSK
jgi:hypothetical protein